MAFKINELSGKLGEIIDKLGATMGYALVEEIEEDYQLWSETCYYYVPKLDIEIYKCSVYEYCDIEKDFELSENMFMVFDSTSKDLLYTYSGLEIVDCLYNYCNKVLKKRYSVERVKNLDCTYMLEKGLPKPKFEIIPPESISSTQTT